MEAIYEVTFTVTHVVRVKFDISDEELVTPGEDPEDVAEEFARAGKGGWPEYIVSMEESTEVESIIEIPSVAIAAE